MNTPTLSIYLPHAMLPWHVVKRSRSVGQGPWAVAMGDLIFATEPSFERAADSALRAARSDFHSLPNHLN